MSPMGTPATEKAQRIANDGLNAAEALDHEGMFNAASELKAATLVEAAQAYAKQRQRQARKQKQRPGRSPLRTMSRSNSAIAEEGEAATMVATEGATSNSAVEKQRPEQEVPEQEVPTSGFPMPPTTPASDRAVVSAHAVRDMYGDLEPRVLPLEIQAVIISNTSLVRHLEGSPFTLFQLHVPLLSGEHVAFRRYSDFVALDATLCQLLGAVAVGRLGGPFAHPLAQALSCFWVRDLPALPPKTLPLLQDPTAPAVIGARWAALQRYLDSALERVAECPEAFDAFKAFLCLP